LDGGDRPELMDKAEILSRLKMRLEELEEEARLVRSMIALLEGEPSEPRPDERVEEVKEGRKRVGLLYVANDRSYIRLVPEGEPPLTSDVKAYLEKLVEELRERQKRQGVALSEDELIQLEIRRGPNGGVQEIVISGIRDLREFVRAQAALKYVAMVLGELSGRRTGAR